ncbi:MAG: sigma-70 family RNA polymerase sigma factor [Candidatus Portnoybacteria bacterium]|nr:sigma-70 family RNA polymerase sigma factor [Candidatus Portnoybacteria bacterium]
MQEEDRTVERQLYLHCLTRGEIQRDQLRTLLHKIGDSRERERVITTLAYLCPGVTIVGEERDDQEKEILQQPTRLQQVPTQTPPLHPVTPDILNIKAEEIPDFPFEEEEKEKGERGDKKDLVKLYFKEVGRYPLLNREEERKLFKEIAEARNGIKTSLARSELGAAVLRDVIEDVHDDPHPKTDFDVSMEVLDKFLERLEKEASRQSPDYDLSTIITDIRKRKGEITSATQKLFRANLRFVVYVVKHSRPLLSSTHLSFLDLVQEGNFGLLRAIEKFDPEKGSRFTTYAWWWVRQAVFRANSDTGSTIRVPVHRGEKMTRLGREKRFFFQSYGRQATDEELEKELGLPIEEIKDLERYTTLFSLRSLDEPMGGDGESVLGDFIASPAMSPEEEVDEGMIADQVRKGLQLLSPREEEILLLRFGIGEKDKYTLEEVGQRFDVTRERIRQIQRKALRKMRRKPFRFFS